MASRLGYTVYIVDERARPGADVLRSLADEGRADGFLLLRDDGDIEDLSPLLTGAVPVVLIGARQRRSGSVVLDDAASSRLATAHLLELGHRDIAFIDARGRTPTTAAGERGFLETIRSAGMRRRSAWLLQGSDPAAGRSAIQRLCSVGGRRPTAVVVADLLAAMGALLGARDVGLAVPQQLSIVALGDAWLADHCWPPLTTVRLPFYELGEHAMHQLHESLAGGPDRDVLVSSPPPRLLCRASTGPPPRRVVRGRLRGLARQGMGEDLR